MIELKVLAIRTFSIWVFSSIEFEFFYLEFFCGVNLLPLLSYFRAGFFVRPSKKLKGIKTQEIGNSRK